jgi:hypothetical protein
MSGCTRSTNPIHWGSWTPAYPPTTMFGSDFPHAEGMADPVAYSEVVAGLSIDDQQLIMGGSIARAMRVGLYAD